MWLSLRRVLCVNVKKRVIRGERLWFLCGGGGLDGRLSECETGAEAVVESTVDFGQVCHAAVKRVSIAVHKLELVTVVEYRESGRVDRCVDRSSQCNSSI